MCLDFGKLSDEVTVFGIDGENVFGTVANQIIQNASGIILIIDSTDYENLEKNMELADFIRSINIPLLIFANKIDMPTSYPLQYLENMFSVYAPLHTGCANEGDGVKDALYEILSTTRDIETLNRPIYTENCTLATDGGKSEVLDVFEYFYGYLQELQNFVVSRNYNSYDKKIKIDSEKESQVLFC